MPPKAPRKIDWERQIGRRFRLRDLHIFTVVAQYGSMGKAAARLRVSQPAVSGMLANLEHSLGVRLFDRSPRGVELTAHGRALLQRSLVVFDELRQGVRDLEFLDDPAAGDLRIGCVESIASTILPPIIEQYARRHPRVVLHVHQLVTANLELRELRDRSLDLILARFVTPLAYDDLNLEVLFDDHLVIVAGKESRWADRTKIDLAELVDEPWILTPPDSWTNMIMADNFRARGLAMPKISLTTFSVYLRASLLASGRYITALPSSMLRFNISHLPLRVLPVQLPIHPWPVAIATLKNRTLSPAVQLFIDHLRAFTSEMAPEPKPEKKSA